MASLEKKPLNGGIPAMAIHPIRKVIISNFKFFTQSAHVPDILFATHGMNHTATAKEQQGFEESMGHYMKYSCCISPASQCQEHKP